MDEFLNSEKYNEFRKIMNKLDFDDNVFVTDFLLSEVRKNFEVKAFLIENNNCDVMDYRGELLKVIEGDK